MCGAQLPTTGDGSKLDRFSSVPDLAAENKVRTCVCPPLSLGAHTSIVFDKLVLRGSASRRRTKYGQVTQTIDLGYIIARSSKGDRWQKNPGNLRSSLFSGQVEYCRRSRSVIRDCR